MRHRVALISEHASPLAHLGGCDAGGQNVYVREVARTLGAMGHEVDIFTRRDSPDTPTVIQLFPFVRVIQVPAGPARFIAKESLLPYMPEFADFIIGFMRDEGRVYTVAHANFFMSGMVAT